MLSQRCNIVTVHVLLQDVSSTQAPRPPAVQDSYNLSDIARPTWNKINKAMIEKLVSGHHTSQKVMVWCYYHTVISPFPQHSNIPKFRSYIILFSPL